MEGMPVVTGADKAHLKPVKVTYVEFNVIKNVSITVLVYGSRCLCISA